MAWLWWVLAAALTGLRWVDLTVLAPMLQAGLVPVGLSLVLLAALALALRSHRLVGATLVLGVVHVVLAVPWWIDSSVPGGDDDLVVAAVNLEFGQGDVDEVADLVLKQDVDVLVLVEATPVTVAALDRSPLSTALPHRSGSARQDAGGTLVLTRVPHEVAEVPNGYGFDQMLVHLQDGGRTWSVVGAHPVPPVGLVADRWRAEQRDLAEWVAALPRPLVVAGDLNASTGHPALRQLLSRADLDPAHRVAGDGWVRSWPRETALPAFVQIDHVLVGGAGVVSAGSFEVSGSDHLGVWARISP